MPTDLPIARRRNMAAKAAKQSLAAALVIGVLPILLILIDAMAIGNGRISPHSLSDALAANGSTCGLTGVCSDADLQP